MKSLKKSTIRLTASPKAVIANFHQLPYTVRVENIVKRVNGFDEKKVEEALQKVKLEFGSRHRNLHEILQDSFGEAENIVGPLTNYSQNRKALLGAYLTKEYSFQAAALFNPSIVPHPDQSNLQRNEQRFIMSLRATGEGHISSIIFKTGIVNDEGDVVLDHSPGYFTVLKKDVNVSFEKEFISRRAAFFPDFDKKVLDMLPDTFTSIEAQEILKKQSAENDSMEKSIAFVEELLDTNYNLSPSPHIPIDEKVIFPSAKSERMGMEDVRFVKFDDGNTSTYYGTYTAYDGKKIKTQLLETTDFNAFKVRSLYGAAINDKGMALFPEKVGGRYVKCSRQGSEMLSIMFSDDLYTWEKYQLLLEPQYHWELVQMGNCGAPIKTERGWLMLTHGVGAMRKYVISAILLQLDDPSKIIGRLDEPFLYAGEDEREGYVPNVVYTCGMLRHNHLVFIPYGISDAATSFVSLEINEILNSMKPYQK